MGWPGFPVGDPAIRVSCGWKLSNKQRNEAAQRYIKGERPTDLAKEFNVSKANIVQLARGRGMMRKKDDT